jgi:glycosyltransferase involved in cell wall biosynthesis
MTAATSVTVIVLTFNENRNLPACLASVAPWARRVVVVDSGSTDGTVDIAKGFGADVIVHPFETHSRQWMFALQSTGVSTDWVLALDADQRVSSELRDSITAFVASGAAAGTVGAYVRRRQIFRGRWIRHGGYYGKHLLKLFRPGAVMVDPSDLVDHHFRAAGPTTRLRGDLIEDNLNEADISVWIAKHNRYAALQAMEEVSRARRRAPAPVAAWPCATPDARTDRLKDIWRRLPLFVRPFVYFTYRYVLRLGFLDGKEGFIFHFLHAYWYRLLVDIKIDELRRRPGTGAP